MGRILGIDRGTGALGLQSESACVLCSSTIFMHKVETTWNLIW
jgi:hypothetical protein